MIFTKHLFNCMNTLFCIISILLIFSISCSKKKNVNNFDHNSTVYVLKDWINNENLPEEARSKALLAKSKYENKTLECEPLLVGAVLLQFEGHEDVKLALLICDESRDINDFEIIEEISDPNGKTIKILQKKLCLGLDRDFITTCDLYLVPYEILIKKIEHNDGTEDIPEQIFFQEGQKNVLYLFTSKRYIVNIKVLVYDREGNKSNVVNLNSNNILH